MKKLILLTLTIALLSGCTPSDSADWNSLKETASKSIKDFELLNSALNKSDITNCDGNCFVYIPDEDVKKHPEQSGPYSIYTYAYGEGGGASAVFKLNTGDYAYYEVVLGGIQDTLSCETLENKQIPAELINICADKDGKTTKRVETKTDDLTYQNDEYGFSLTLPKTWEGYTVSKREFELNIGLVPSLDFGFQDQESVFNISMYTTAQWESMAAEGGPLPAEIGKNAKFVFAYSPAEKATNETISQRLNEVTDIILSFKAN